MSDAQRAERVDIDEIYNDDIDKYIHLWMDCLLYTSPSPRDRG